MSRHTARPALERFVFIAAMLRAGKPFNTCRISHRFEVCRATVKRDLQFMRDRLRYEFDFDYSRNTYRLRSAPEPVL